MLVYSTGFGVNGFTYEPSLGEYFLSHPQMKIKDDGKGIPEEFQPHIFERFFRGQKNDQYKAKGFGIGLSYVKFVMEAHNGTIHLNTQHKIGTEFIIKLPL